METQIYELTESDMKKIRRGQDSVRYYQGLGQGALDLANGLPCRIKINEYAECENDFQRGYFIGYDSPNNLQHMIELNPNFSQFKSGEKKLPKLNYAPKPAHPLCHLPLAYQKLYDQQFEKYFGPSSRLDDIEKQELGDAIIENHRLYEEIQHSNRHLT